MNPNPDGAAGPKLDAGVQGVVGSGWRGKRAFDVMASSLLIVVFAPLMILIALLVRLTSRGPVLHRQHRVGRHGKEFELLKFRSMRVDAMEVLAADEALFLSYLANDHKLPDRDDPRITAVGLILRRLSIDELPQLFNILAGDMSLVGPRPVEELQLAQYGDLMECYLALRPGLTGVWQVSGRDNVRFPHRAYMDRDYVETCSLRRDLTIILKTPAAMLRARREAS